MKECGVRNFGNAMRNMNVFSQEQGGKRNGSELALTPIPSLTYAPGISRRLWLNTPSSLMSFMHVPIMVASILDGPIENS